MKLSTLAVLCLAGYTHASCAAPGVDLIQNGDFEASTTNITGWGNVPSGWLTKSGFESSQAFGALHAKDVSFVPSLIQNVSICPNTYYVLGFEYFNRYPKGVSFSARFGTGLPRAPIHVSMRHSEPEWANYSIWILPGLLQGRSQQLLFDNLVGQLLDPKHHFRPIGPAPQLSFGIDKVSLKSVPGLPIADPTSTPIVNDTSPGSANKDYLFPTTPGKTYLITFSYKLSIALGNAFTLGVYIDLGDDFRDGGISYETDQVYGPVYTTKTLTLLFVAVPDRTHITLDVNALCGHCRKVNSIIPFECYCPYISAEVFDVTIRLAV